MDHPGFRKNPLVDKGFTGRICLFSGLKNMVFTTHTTYKDDIMISLAKSCCHVTRNKNYDEWMTFFGKCFVNFCHHYGYSNLLRVAGRHFRDFLHGIDNIHEMIRFSYPQLCSPSFLVTSEDSDGCVLLYQSKRKGFKHYVIGQLKECASQFYNVNVTISIQEEIFVDNKCHVKLRLDFDNSVYTPKVVQEKSSGSVQFSSISSDSFLTVSTYPILMRKSRKFREVEGAGSKF